jgi:hypothetical protein
MSGAIPSLPNTLSSRGAQLKHRDNFTFIWNIYNWFLFADSLRLFFFQQIIYICMFCYVAHSLSRHLRKAYSHLRMKANQTRTLQKDWFLFWELKQLFHISKTINTQQETERSVLCIQTLLSSCQAPRLFLSEWSADYKSVPLNTRLTNTSSSFMQTFFF